MKSVAVVIPALAVALILTTHAKEPNKAEKTGIGPPFICPSAPLQTNDDGTIMFYCDRYETKDCLDPGATTATLKYDHPCPEYCTDCTVAYYANDKTPSGTKGQQKNADRERAAFGGVEGTFEFSHLREGQAGIVYVRPQFRTVVFNDQLGTMHRHPVKLFTAVVDPAALGHPEQDLRIIRVAVLIDKLPGSTPSDPNPHGYKDLEADPEEKDPNLPGGHYRLRSKKGKKPFLFLVSDPRPRLTPSAK